MRVSVSNNDKRIGPIDVMRAPLVAALVAVGFVRCAAAESALPPSGFTTHAAVAVGRDDNLFRLPGGRAVTGVPNGNGDRADTLRRIDLGTGVEAQISRQVIGVGFDAYAVRYTTYDFLDHEGGVARAFWHWQAGSAWEGNLDTVYKREQAQFGNLQTPLNDLVTTRGGSVEAIYHPGPRLSLRGGASASEERHSDESREQLDRTVRRGAFGIDYRSPTANRLGIESAFSEIDFDERVAFGSSRSDYGYSQSDTHLVAELHRNPRHQFDLRAGYTEQQHDDPSKNEFAGFTGSLKYRFGVTDVTRLILRTWRDATPIDDVTSSYILADGVRVGAVWKMTPTVDLDLSATREWRQFLGQPDTLRDLVRADTVTSYGGTLDYRPSRSLSLSLSATNGVRNSTVNDRDYVYDEVWFAARVEF